MHQEGGGGSTSLENILKKTIILSASLIIHVLYEMRMCLYESAVQGPKIFL